MFHLRDIPNLLSVLRILLVPPVVFYMLQEQFLPALVLFVIAGLTDSLDGWLAKNFNWESALGKILDPLADKLLLVSSYVCFYWLDFLPLWLVVSIILRDVFIVVGGVAYRIFFGKVDINPSYMSKLNTLMQIVLVTTMLLSLTWLPIQQQVITILIWTVLFTTVVSGLMYIFSWTARAYKEASQNKLKKKI